MNFFNIGPMELLLVLTVVLILFGPDKIPDIAGSIGKMLGQFRQASKNITEELDLEDLSPSSIANALEAKATADEKAEGSDAEEDDSPPALPAATQPAETPAARPEPDAKPNSTPGENETPTRRFHMPGESPTDVSKTEAPASGEDDASKRRFHLPAEAQADPSESRTPSPRSSELTVDYESPEDAD
jgi:TatA/E family protein of Tat protein translocase